MSASDSAVRTRPTPAEVKQLLTPRSIAVLGASSDPKKFTGKFIPVLCQTGYAGAIYPINPARQEIAGVPCYPDLSAVPGSIDCVIVCIAPADVPAVLPACEAKGVKLLILPGVGFAERGDDEGLQLQAHLTAFAKRTGTRIIGPNCVGYMNLVDSVMASAGALLEGPPMIKGGIGVVSQSGGLGLASLPVMAAEEEVGFSYLISTGNEADLDLVDFADFLVDDPTTHVIALTIEAIRDGRAFLKFLERAGQAGKPVVVLKSGSTELGKLMAASHTGALAIEDKVFDTVCAHYGVTRVYDVDEMIQIAQMFAKLRAAGKLTHDVAAPAQACAALSVSGGHLGLIADQGSLRGLRFPPLQAHTQTVLKQYLERIDGVFNPIDLSGPKVAGHPLWKLCIEALFNDPAIEVVIPIITIHRNYDEVSHDFIKLAATSSKILIAVWPGSALEGEKKSILRRSMVPLFHTPGAAARGIAALHRFCSVWVGRPPVKAMQAAVPHPLIVAASTANRPTLSERESKTVLADWGFPVTRERLARSASEAVQAALTIGLPVALKGEHARIQHKTEAGIVHLHLATGDDVANAYAQIDARMHAHGDEGKAGVLVQQMIAPGTEIILGVKRDALFGPIVLFGLGGIFVEVFQDVALRLAPLDMAGARAMMDETRGIALLKGARGAVPCDLDAIAQLIVRLGDFSLAHADSVLEVDINPLVVDAQAHGVMHVVDALIVLGSGAAGSGAAGSR